jgi:large subunit ribosomal protein L30
MSELRITQVKSSIGTKPKHRDALRTLGLRRIRHCVVREDTPSLRGVVHSVRHLVTVEEVADR